MSITKCRVLLHFQLNNAGPDKQFMPDISKSRANLFDRISEPLLKNANDQFVVIHCNGLYSKASRSVPFCLPGECTKKIKNMCEHTTYFSFYFIYSSI